MGSGGDSECWWSSASLCLRETPGSRKRRGHPQLWRSTQELGGLLQQQLINAQTKKKNETKPCFEKSDCLKIKLAHCLAHWTKGRIQLHSKGNHGSFTAVQELHFYPRPERAGWVATPNCSTLGDGSLCLHFPFSLPLAFSWWRGW